jgi:NAD(P)-dependent dehydrogenase (short-subunit alcohol dehydrogenase family)
VAEGARVVAADINGHGAEQLAGELGDAATPYTFDLRDEAQVRDLIDSTVERFGRLDLLHNNAVTAGRSDGMVEDADAKTWDLAYEVNLRGYMLGCKYAIPHMKRAGGGVIVNMASDSALAGDMMLSAYGCTKAAVITLTQYVATQYGKDGIRCVSVTPGAMLTDSMRNHMGAEGVAMLENHHLTPRLGKPSDLAALMVYLASDESEFLTGINIPLDGGYYSHLPTTADLRRLQR